MLDIIFYFQILVMVSLIGIAFYTRSWAFFGLAGVFVILTGATLASGESIDYVTGSFTIIEGADGDVNKTAVVPDFNSITSSNDNSVWMWGTLMMYGGFVLIVLAFVFAIKNIAEGRAEASELEGY